ncbi:acyltransferase domain-containing protein [Paenibacillus hodogayensis]|uniref:Acyltransferase domain-containing protein n=1 Tax=Paenibacillus hodogayensis TaxID=279208 RepID=A0ABV5W1P1_9BACL
MTAITFISSLSACDTPDDYLRLDYIAAASELLQLSAEITDAFVQATALLQADDRLSEIVSRCHRVLFHSQDGLAKKEVMQELLALEQSEEDQWAAMLIPIVLLSGLPHTVQIYRERDIPMEVLTETLSDLELRMRIYKNQRGLWGANSIHWLIQHFTGEMFRLGRLQFQLKLFPYSIHAFRHRSTGEVAIFPDNDIPFRSDGCIDGTNGVYNCAWISKLMLTEQQITGHRITSDGLGVPETTVLQGKEWEHVLKPRDTAIVVHIPADGKMAHEQCRDSYSRAVHFFDTYFPEKPFSVIFCATWLLSPQWQKLLPSHTNIVQFRQDYHPFPILSDDHQTFERVFGTKPVDLASAPRDTQLRRAILDYLLAGHAIHSGAGILLKNAFLGTTAADRM